MAGKVWLAPPRTVAPYDGLNVCLNGTICYGWCHSAVICRFYAEWTEINLRLQGVIAMQDYLEELLELLDADELDDVESAWECEAIEM
jgi:hypothetical protein